jgi:hypothetical protein
MKRHDLFTWEGEGKSMKRMHRTILGLVASVVMVGALALFGCGDGDGGGTEACSATNLANRTFTFSSGAPFNLGAVTLVIGPTGTTFTLTATVGGVLRTALGTIIYNPFTLTVSSVTPTTGLPAGFPGAGASFTSNSCTLDLDSGIVTITNLSGSTGSSGG